MRYIPQTASEREQMLKSVGIDSVETLFDCIPSEVRLKELPDLPPAMTESQLMAHLSQLASKNNPAGDKPSFLGAGVYDHYVPSVINHMLLRQEFFTAYTPYQPEISQGTLTAVFEYQTMICNLTGLDVSNASLYDSATAAAEAMYMCSSQTRRKKILLAASMHPELRATVKTYAQFAGIEVLEAPYDPETGKIVLPDLSEIAGVYVSSPNFFGVVEDMEAVASAAHAAGALAVACVDPLSLALLKTPGECGFDIAIGETQPLGLKMSFGGPYCGFISCTTKLMRKLPGRIAGQTVDSEGRRAFVLTLQAREQHIRREKATSNICSNQALCALATTIYLSLVGPVGLKECAQQSVGKAAYLKDKLLSTGKFEQIFFSPYFREFAVRCKNADPETINATLKQHGFIGGYDLGKHYPELSGCMLLAVTEQRTKCEIDAFAERMAEI